MNSKVPKLLALINVNPAIKLIDLRGLVKTAATESTSSLMRWSLPFIRKLVKGKLTLKLWSSHLALD
jgi:hypothetical protein